MNKHIKKAISAFCAVSIVSSLFVPAAAASVSHDDSYDIANGLNYTIASSENDTVRQQSFRLDYTPGRDIKPIVAYGSKLYGKSNITEIVNFVEKQGQSVYGAANADFFVISSGLPSGLVVNDGRLVSSDGMWNAVGIMPDGRVIAGAPKMAMSLYSSTTGDYPIYAFNKQRTSSGIYLLNSDFSSATRSTGTGTDVVLQPVDSSPFKIGQPKQFTVAAVSRVDGSAPMVEGEFVLTASDAYSDRGFTISALVPGETVTINTSVLDERFRDVQFACGGGDMLMKNGVIQSGISGGTREPRTLLGTRPDGSAVAMVHDGRQTTSLGLTLKESAELMAAQGCTDIVNLDGGGSSAEAIRQPGADKTEVVNSPSDSGLRKCANYILFVNTAKKTGEESGAFIYPHDIGTLKGAKIELEAKTYDKHYYPVSSYSSGFSIVETNTEANGNIITAPEKAGDYNVTFKHATATAVPSKLKVYQKPDRIVVKNGKTAITSLSLTVGEQAWLDIDAFADARQLIETDDVWDWSVTGNIGTIKPNGEFTASTTSGVSGEIIIKMNDFSYKIPVSVGKMPSILDGFETPVTYTVNSDNAAATGASSVTTALENVRYGRGALAMSYSAGALDTAATISYTAEKPIALASNAKSITFFSKATAEKQMTVFFETSDGNRVARTFLATPSYAVTTIDVPSGAKNIIGFATAVAPNESGSVYIDHIVSYFDSVQPDVVAPEITLEPIVERAVSGTIIDKSGFPIPKANIVVQCDGNAIDFNYNSQTGELGAPLPSIAEGPHRITITAKDVFANLSRTTVSTGESFTATAFADMQEHWGRDYAEFLRVKNVFATDTSFNPENATTNEMTATLISRYLNLDTAQYANVELPYYDKDQIAEWAMPHVKALYSKGIMLGGSDSTGARAFFPKDSISRAQVITILGRTLERGYSYTSALFDDMATTPNWAQDHINLLSSLGVVSGYGNTNNVNPLGNITRAEFAALLFKFC